MNPVKTLTQSQLSEFLLHVALVRPVFIWGPPGIGKSSLVTQFADSLGLPCVSLLGSQLAPEDLLGVPRIEDGVSRFCPPANIARNEPYCLFLDELNACSHEVQKAFYSLIHEQPVDWTRPFAAGLQAVASALEGAAHGGSLEGRRASRAALDARSWFMASYPLLGGLAAAFEIVENAEVCHRLDIQVAAIDDEAREVYINPRAGLSTAELRFVMAHELLHAGLRHSARRQGRDPFLWNVACDYVINGWLVEMRVGEIPGLGLLHDPELAGLSAEAIYDRIVTDLRRYRKLSTFRGRGVGDILGRRPADWWRSAVGMDLDAFYRESLARGFALHRDQGRGLLPAGLVEEIRALGQPPIPWDVELARWFDAHFPPLEKRRSYARSSRRQSATPEIPRPRWVAEDGGRARTFAVVLDTSGSMDRTTLAKGLGVIASYSLARDVAAVRVLFCDAAVYDQGYLPPESLAHRVEVRGRGGTVLQPAFDLLDEAQDFPSKGPALIITDGCCDRLEVRREHAFLLPAGADLPFVPKGPVFRIR